MKTFKSLSIGDTIYRLCSKYELGNPEKTQVSTVIIESLSVDKENGNLLINKNTPYSGTPYWSIVVKSDKLNMSHYNFNPEQNTHRQGFYFINESDANYIVKRAVVSKIASIEKSIPETIARSKKEICNLRSTFHEILNPSFYPEFNIV